MNFEIFFSIFSRNDIFLLERKNGEETSCFRLKTFLLNTSVMIFYLCESRCSLMVGLEKLRGLAQLFNKKYNVK